MVRLFPEWLVNGIFILASDVHFRMQSKRREIVVRNLLPACSGDRMAALKTARRLYHNFGRKLADLWRVESGQSVNNWTTHPAELEIIRNASRRGQGVLLLTLHLGNWEHGGLLLAQLGIKLTILTLAEPDKHLTAMRTASRARWGIDTLIIGQDGFAFVEVIKRLQAGDVLAIALDRPPQRNHVTVELFGMPFNASLAAAELARASGCALVGVTIVRRPDGFVVKALPEFAYNRQSLGNRQARWELTQQILRAFEPEIRQNLDQWYQFIPIWPDDKPPIPNDAGNIQSHENV
jgi:KDO2-lipid IV(A) lauroyltransferase